MPIPVSSNLVPRNGNTWPVVEDIFVKGGYRTVSTRADLLAIPASTHLWSLGLLKLTCDDLIQRTTANLRQLASLYV